MFEVNVDQQSLHLDNSDRQTHKVHAHNHCGRAMEHWPLRIYPHAYASLPKAGAGIIAVPQHELLM